MRGHRLPHASLILGAGGNLENLVPSAVSVQKGGREVSSRPRAWLGICVSVCVDARQRGRE